MIEINNDTKTKINLDLVKKVTEIFLSKHKILEKNVSIAFVGDKKITALNKLYRNIDKTTDILSFCGDLDDLGELVLNFSQIKRQAKKYDNSDEEELVFILVHGLLHLIGYEDDTDDDALKMEKLGKNFIKKYV